MACLIKPQLLKVLMQTPWPKFSMEILEGNDFLFFCFKAPKSGHSKKECPFIFLPQVTHSTSFQAGPQKYMQVL